MPASIYSASESGVPGVSSLDSKDCESGAELLALQLASMFQPPQNQPLSNTGIKGLACDSYLTNSTETDLVPSFSAIHLCDSDSEEQKLRSKSSNTTECVPVPSSEHVAEIVGRQGCKIKALRAKTNTYIKTPVRGNEPVFIVTGRKEDVAAAKQEILSAADHFTHIRAARKSNINSTLALGQLMANTPGQTTIQVRVPYEVVGLVVGPKGATIKRIQQQTHTYIVTPSREKEPIFEITGLPDNVEVARREIEAHIAMRTGQLDMNGGDLDINFGGVPGVIGSRFSPVNNFGFNNFDGTTFDRMTSTRSNNVNSNDLSLMDSRYDPFTSGLLGRPGIGSSAIARSSSGSQDSGIENSSPLDTAMFNNNHHQQTNMINLIQPSTNVFSNIWSTSNDGLSNVSLELGGHPSLSGLGFGNFTSIQSDATSKKAFDSRLSLDLGQPLFDGWNNELATTVQVGNDSSMLNIISHC